MAVLAADSSAQPGAGAASLPLRTSYPSYPVPSYRPTVPHATGSSTENRVSPGCDLTLMVPPWPWVMML